MNQKRVALSVGKTPKVLFVWKSKGKVEHQKLLKILLAKDQKDPLVKEEKRLSHFFWLKECFVSQITYLQ